MLRKKFSFLTSLAAHHSVLAEAGPGLPVLIKHGGQISGHYFHIQSNCLRVFLSLSIWWIKIGFCLLEPLLAFQKRFSKTKKVS